MWFRMTKLILVFLSHHIRSKKRGVSAVMDDEALQKSDLGTKTAVASSSKSPRRASTPSEGPVVKKPRKSKTSTGTTTNKESSQDAIGTVSKPTVITTIDNSSSSSRGAIDNGSASVVALLLPPTSDVFEECPEFNYDDFKLVGV